MKNYNVFYKNNILLNVKGENVDKLAFLFTFKKEENKQEYLEKVGEEIDDKNYYIVDKELGLIVCSNKKKADILKEYHSEEMQSKYKIARDDEKKKLLNFVNGYLNEIFENIYRKRKK